MISKWVLFRVLLYYLFLFTMKQISILGCGWLGLPLAKALLKENITIKGSTTSGEKLSVLSSMGIDPFLIALNGSEVIGDVGRFLEASDTLIIDIPPKLGRKNSDPKVDSEKEFVAKMKALIPYIKKSSVQNLLFVSSTSVYGDAKGTITEETTPQPNTESGRQLLEAENLFQNNDTFETTILRFGGLVGEDRNPIKFLAGKQNLENPETPINFIHQEDCIGIILKIINTSSWNETYNGVSPFHPSREEYYTQKAIEFGLDLPHFDHSKPSLEKVILGDKLKRILAYNFIKTNL